MKRDDCPICGKPTDPANKPFCGRGCKDRDLLQWLGEGYRIPGERAENHVRSGLDSEADAD